MQLSRQQKSKEHQWTNTAISQTGYTNLLKIQSGTNEIQGISFSKGEYKFKGSEIDRSLSYSKLFQAIEYNQANREKSIADQLRDVIQPSKQD